jgi:hypothetical protein
LLRIRNPTGITKKQRFLRQKKIEAQFGRAFKCQKYFVKYQKGKKEEWLQRLSAFSAHSWRTCAR